MRLITWTFIGAALALSAREGAAATIPPWARKYNMNCSGCHYPTVPRLNEAGLRFKWAGYRMPGEINEKMELKRIEEYLAARGIVQYSVAKTQGQPADVNGLNAGSASVFAAGGLGANYGAYLEFEREEEGAVDLVAQVVGAWGRENAYGGVRAGQGHLLVGGAIAGFDRATGILTPLPLAQPVTPGVPFRFTGDVAGIEAFYVLGGRNRTSVGIANGLTAGDEEMEPSTSSDFVVTNQLMWDDAGSGLTAIGYFGSIRALDTAQANLRSRYARVGVSANKFMGPFELQGGYVYSGNSRLPVGATSPFGSRSLTGSGYWLSGAYIVPKRYWTVYSRFEALDPDLDVSDDRLSRMVLGSVLPVNVPEYFRLGLEYFRDMPQLGGAPWRHGITGQVHVAF